MEKIYKVERSETVGVTEYYAMMAKAHPKEVADLFQDYAEYYHYMEYKKQGIDCEPWKR